MSGEIVFYHNPRSRSQMVRWMLEEVGAPYRLVPIDFEKQEHKKPEFLALNPMGKLPTLVHGTTVITETAAIITYLADAFPAAGLAPAGTDPRRGTYLRWLFFGAGCFEPALLDTMFKRSAVENKGALGYGSYEETLNALKKMLEPGPFILGEQFSAADVYLGAQLGWATSFGAPGLKEEPRFMQYLGRISQRPAYARAAKLDGRELPKAQG
jgi:glutathione S-transferase